MRTAYSPSNAMERRGAHDLAHHALPPLARSPRQSMESDGICLPNRAHLRLRQSRGGETTRLAVRGREGSAGGSTIATGDARHAGTADRDGDGPQAAGVRNRFTDLHGGLNASYRAP